jgi:hypothetical protein
LAGIVNMSSNLAAHRWDVPIFFERELEVTYRIGPAPESGWDVYRVQLIPAEESLRSPNWVVEWSRETPIGGEIDAISIADDIVQMALRTVTQNQPMLEHFIAVRRRRK